MAINFQATNLNVFGFDGPGQASFVFDDLGFGPKTFSYRVDDGLIGLDIPRVSAGFDLDITLGARLIVEAGFDMGQLDISYTTGEGSFVGQSDLSVFLDSIQDSIKDLPHYRNKPIVFDAGNLVLGAGGTMTVDAADLEDTYVKVSLGYDFGLVARNFGIRVEIPVFDDLEYTAPLAVDLLDLATGGALSGVQSDTIELFSLTLADLIASDDEHLFSVDTGAFAGTYFDLPSPPDFDPQPPTGVVVPTDGGLPSLTLDDDADPPFAYARINIGQLIFEKTGIPVSVGFDPVGGVSIDLEPLQAVLGVGLSVAQELTFTPEAILVRLELFDPLGASTGQVVQGVLGDDLRFDLPGGFGNATVQATYTLYGTLESVTGLRLSGSFDAGLLAGRFVNTIGPDFDIGFGPLIPLLDLDYTSGILPLLTNRTGVAFGSETRSYTVYYERTPEATDGPDNETLTPSDIFFNAEGGDDTIRGLDITPNVILGGSGDDSIIGAEPAFPGDPVAADQLEGGFGDDTLQAGSGNDLLLGGEGGDLIFGGGGDDTMVAGPTDSPDGLFGGPGIDLAIVNRGGLTEALSFTVNPLATIILPDGTVLNGVDRIDLRGGFGDDEVTGGAWQDALLGQWGNDTLDGGGGFDIIEGGAGDDLLVVGTGGLDDLGDLVEGGSGIDTVVLALTGVEEAIRLDFRNGFSAVPETFTRYQTVTAGPGGAQIVQLADNVEAVKLFHTFALGNDVIVGGRYADLIVTGFGNDSIDGWLGRDSLLGGDGNDTIVSTDADFALDGGGGQDLLRLDRSAAPGGVSLDFSAGGGQTLGDGTFVNSFERLEFTGGAAADRVMGGTGNDVLRGGGGADWLAGGRGNDVVQGGAGNDTIAYDYYTLGELDDLEGGADADLIVLDWSGAGSFTPTPLEVSLADPAAVQTLATGVTLSGFERGEITGGAGNDIIRGGAGEVQTFTRAQVSLAGQTSYITLPGPMLSDIIRGGDGNDWIDGGDGRDIVSGGAGDDTIVLSADGDQIDGGDGFDTLFVPLGALPPRTVIDFGSGAAPIRLRDGTILNDPLVTLPDGTRISGMEAVEFQTSRVLGADIPLRLSLTSLADRITGGIDADDIRGALGNDTIIGGGGLDSLDGGLGDDRLELYDPFLGRPGFGLGEIRGGGGDDDMFAAIAGLFDGGDGFDVLTLSFLDAAAPLTVDLRDAVAGALASNGTEIRGTERVSLGLGVGDDQVSLAFGDHAVNAGGGFDVAGIDRGLSLADESFAFQLSLDLARVAGPRPTANTLRSGDGMALTEFERFDIATGAGDDRIDLATNRALGPGQDDSLSGGAGNDTLAGGAGNDRLDGGAGRDRADYGTATGPVVARLADGDGATSVQDGIISGMTFASPWGTDLLFGIEDLWGGAGGDTLVGNSGANRLNGGAGNDWLEGGAGGDVLQGGRGADVLVLGAGRDVAAGGSGADRFVLAARDGRDVIRDFTTGRDGDLLDLRPLLDLLDAAGADPFASGRLGWRDTADGAELLLLGARRAGPTGLVLLEGLDVATILREAEVLIA